VCVIVAGGGDARLDAQGALGAADGLRFRCVRRRWSLAALSGVAELASAKVP
jgi:hypothetical protein